MKALCFLLLIGLILSLGVNGYFLMSSRTPTAASDRIDLRELQKKYPYLSQKIISEYDRDILINFLDLRNKLDAEVIPYKDSFALYFEYLPSGTNIGINEDAEFYAASLIKVPIVMAYYHQRERLGQTDDPVITLTEDDINSKYGTLWKKGPGTTLKMSEAIRLALTESDNTAGDAILHRIEEKDFMRVYEGLDIPLRVENEETIITAQQYASVLKALFYSSLLSKESSQEILSWLTKTKYTDKLPAGINDDIPIAHKVGVLGDQIYQDCGIVYMPKRPYLLCMISRSDEKTASDRMKSVSGIVYSYVKSSNVSGFGNE